VSFAAIILCLTSQRVFIVVSVYFFVDSVRKLLDMHSYDSRARNIRAGGVMPVPIGSGSQQESRVRMRVRVTL
jgi:hypothetical protein